MKILPSFTSGLKCLKNSAQSKVAMCNPSESASAKIHIFPYLKEEISALPGNTPIAVDKFFISCDFIISSLSKSQVFKIFPLNGIIA